MRHWFVFLSVLITAGLDLSQGQPFMQGPGGPGRGNKKTDIRNKNVNIIVNMDPKQVAAELWNVMREHLGTLDPRQAAMTMRQIESAITPVVMPSRRGGNIPVAQVAQELESITRHLITNENPSIDPMELETLTKEVSSDLMQSLQSFWYGVEIDPAERKKSKERPKKKLTLDDASEYIDFTVKIKKSELSEAILEL